MSVKKIIIPLLFLSLFFVVLYSARPPGEPFTFEKALRSSATLTQYLSAGKLPGITWADDIHPIFIRNKCNKCHTKGEEATVEGLSEYSLGMIDPTDINNPYYSYHELVYAEGPPHIEEGEVLRDGQCCWPRKYPEEQQRRVWVGHPERSAILRKLEQDYFNWNKPPRFLEEGLRLLWGMPMPMFNSEKDKHVAEYQPDTNQNKKGEQSSAMDKALHSGIKEHDYKTASFLRQSFIRLALWFGYGQENLAALPPKIPAKDRAILRYWIMHTVQLITNGTGIEVMVLDEKGIPLQDATVKYIGNFNKPSRPEVNDIFSSRTDESGKTVLHFPKLSVVTSFWYVIAEHHGVQTELKLLRLEPGELLNISVSIM
jgi:hypothetical protein